MTLAGLRLDQRVVSGGRRKLVEQMDELFAKRPDRQLNEERAMINRPIYLNKHHKLISKDLERSKRKGTKTKRKITRGEKDKKCTQDFVRETTCKTEDMGR
jgi:hypothetical protein